MDVHRAYEILMERKINEDQVAWQRMSSFLLSNSFLLIAFFTAVPYESFVLVHITLPIVAIMLCLGFGWLFFVGGRTMRKWNKSLKKLEEDDDFNYMEERNIRPVKDIEDKGTLRSKFSPLPRTQYFGMVGFCGALIILWTICLIEIIF